MRKPHQSRHEGPQDDPSGFIHVLHVDYIRVRRRSALDGRLIDCWHVGRCEVITDRGRRAFAAAYEARTVGYPRRALELAHDAANDRLRLMRSIPDILASAKTIDVIADLDLLLSCNLAVAGFSESLLDHGVEELVE